MAGNLQYSSSSAEESDVLMVDPFLEYINEILMEEGTEDPPYMQQVEDASYQSIFRGFSEILGEPALPNSFEGFLDPHPPSRNMYSQHENGPDELCISENGYSLNPNSAASGVPLPPKDHPDDCFTQQQDGYGNFKMPSASDDLVAKLAKVYLSCEDLKLKSAYSDLYLGEPSSLGSSTRAPRDIKHNRDKKKTLAVAKYGDKSGEKSSFELQFFVNVREVLMSCAQAVAIGDTRRANQLLQELRQIHGASANGTGLQRTAHFFGQALEARLRGTGWQQFKALSNSMPSAASILKATKVGFELTPSVKVMHYFANQSILKAAKGASRLHVVDYGLLYGMQWPCLINALADRKGGPPLLVVTGIDSPQPGIDMAERLDDSGRRLAAYAKTYRVPFQFHAIVTSKWEELDVASLYLCEGEVIVLNSIKSLPIRPEESTDLSSTISSRQILLNHMHSLKPHLLVTGVTSAACNSPFFLYRFREALYLYSNVFDMMDIVWGDNPQRLIVERSCYYHDILNIVACEGAERVKRHETHKEWHRCITHAGFEQLPIPSAILSRSRAHVKQHHHKDFFIEDYANGWMLLGWKGRATLAISAWKPRLTEGQ